MRALADATKAWDRADGAAEVTPCPPTTETLLGLAGNPTQASDNRGKLSPGAIIGRSLRQAA
ncbi:hypothetical protein GCM10010983_14510 [Caulobacter rhizosphaerae]|jgi:hypothetical protein|nr:hypothetical protein GCM10010983_14510 [Caulobacter rhizosphaerae]